MSPTRKSIRESLARSAASFTSVGDRSIATTRAPRRAASADSAPVPQPASSRVRPVMSSGSQDSSVARISSRPARTVARMRDSGASEVSRAQAAAAVRSKYVSSLARVSR